MSEESPFSSKLYMTRTPRVALMMFMTKNKMRTNLEQDELFPSSINNPHPTQTLTIKMKKERVMMLERMMLR